MKQNPTIKERKGRRSFIKNSTGVMLFIGASGVLPQLISCKNKRALAVELEKHPLTAWVQLMEDGQIIIYNPAAEMGQGSMTSLPAIFAEEMDADWSKVQVEFSPQESETYGSDGWSPDRKVMLSAGSRITKGYFNLLRKAGAQARWVLMYSVAKKYDVPVEELTTEPGFVVHKESNRRIGYGEIVSFLEMPSSLPQLDELQLKNPKDFRLIGKSQLRTDIPCKIDGTAKFAIDIRLPNMLYGVLERGTIHGSTPALKNEAEVLAMHGVVKVVQLDYAIGIISKTLEDALAAKDKLEIDWGETKATGFNSQDVYEQYKALLSKNRQGNIITDEGNFNRALSNSSKYYTADFKNDYVYHAQMEPLNAVAQISEDMQHAEVWVGSQQGFDSKLGVPKLLDVPPENVKINLQYLGGGFGRRSMTDFVEECVMLAKEVPSQPVKLIWTREDDLRYGAYRPISLQRLVACVDHKGDLTGLSHMIAGDGDRLVASGIKNAFYNIPNQHAEIRTIAHGIRLKHWRAVGHGPNKFAIECMIDHVANDQGVDPVDYRRRLMKNSPKALATLEKAANLAQWDAPVATGRAKGVAFLERSGTLSTGICEISLNRTTGKITVHHFWSAHDAGIIVQPDNVKAQIEGGIIMGMSSVLKEQLTIVNGAVQQSNFHDYEILRIEDIPESIETALINSDEPPQGVGESGTPMVACAIANAFFKLTGKQLNHLPFTPDRVLMVLQS